MKAVLEFNKFGLLVGILLRWKTDYENALMSRAIEQMAKNSSWERVKRLLSGILK